jgi:hypothetical protein
MFDLTPPEKISLSEVLAKQRLDMGLDPIRIEPCLLLERIKQGGHSGQYLADAFLSAYRPAVRFNRSLSEINKLDPEAFRLLHGILHIRHVSGWDDNQLYCLEHDIKALLSKP